MTRARFGVVVGGGDSQILFFPLLPLGGYDSSVSLHDSQNLVLGKDLIGVNF